MATTVKLRRPTLTGSIPAYEGSITRRQKLR